MADLVAGLKDGIQGRSSPMGCTGDPDRCSLACCIGSHRRVLQLAANEGHLDTRVDRGFLRADLGIPILSSLPARLNQCNQLRITRAHA